MPSSKQQTPRRFESVWGVYSARNRKPEPDCLRSGREVSGENAPDQFSVHIGQTHIAAAEAVGQALVIDAEQMQQSCVQVVHLYLVFDREVAVFIGGPVNGARLDAAPRQPDRE